MTQPVSLVSGGRLAKNTLINFVGKVIPVLAAIVTIPYVVHKLGPEWFGILSLAWVVLAYFNLIDLGLGRATTKFVAEALGQGNHDKIPVIVWTSLFLNMGLASLAVGIYVLITPWLVVTVLHIPKELVGEAIHVFRVLAVLIIFTVVNLNLVGVLQAYQRFDLVNVVGVPSQTLTYVLPAIILYYGGNISHIALGMVIKSIITTGTNFLLCIWIARIHRISFSFSAAQPLFSFGGWIFLHNIAATILIQLDRFLVGALLTVTAVTFYTVPIQLATQFLIIPSSLMVVLFPAIATIGTMSKKRLQAIYKKAFIYLTLVMVTVLSPVIIFAREILQYWMGEEFLVSAPLLQLFTVGILWSSLAWLAGTVLQSTGRPEIVTITNLIQIPVYVLALWFMIDKFGIIGAALTWALQKGVIGLILYRSSWKLDIFRPARQLAAKIITYILLTTALTTTVLVLKSGHHLPLSVAALFLLGSFAAYGVIAWYFLEQQDRAVITTMLLSKWQVVFPTK